MTVWTKEHKYWMMERQAQPKGTYMSIFEHVKMNKEKKAREVAELEAMWENENG